MPFEVWTGDRTGMKVKTDKFGRFYLTAGLVTALGLSNGAKLYVAYDPARKMVGLRTDPPADTRAVPLKFDAKRYVASARAFMTRYGLNRERAVFEYIGEEDGWWAFQRVEDA